MILTLMEAGRMKQMILPQQPEGRFDICNLAGTVPLMQIDGASGVWKVRVKHGCKLFANALPELRGNMLLPFVYANGTRKGQLFAEESTVNRKKFARVAVAPGTTLRIGSGKDNDLICNASFAEEHHLVLTYGRHREWTMEDVGTKYGVYLNGQLTQKAVAKPGDQIWMMGQKWIVLPGILAFNNPDLQLKNNTKQMVFLKKPDIGHENFYHEPKEPVYFNRMPRFTDELKEEKLHIDAPPVQQKREPQSALLTVGPAVTSGLFMLMGGMASVLSMGMMASNLIFPSIGRKKEKEKQEEYEARRKEAYTQYLNSIEEKIGDMIVEQTKKLQDAAPAAETQVRKLLGDKHHLWDRQREHSDFMCLRLGVGDIPLKCEVNLPQEHFEMDDDPLRNMMRQVQEKERTLHHVPIIMNMMQYAHCGICGSREDTQLMIANLLMQLSTQYGYDELKIVLIGNLSKPLRPFARLPHTWNNDKSEHLIAWNEEELFVLLPVIDRLLSPYLASGTQRNQDDTHPEIVIFLFDSALAQRGVVTRLLFDKKYEHVHFITFAEHTYQLSRKCDMVIGLNGNTGILRNRNNERIRFIPDHPSEKYIAPLVDMIENTLLDLPENAYAMPDMVPFLKLFGVEDVRALNIISRWKRNNPTRSLAAPIGIDEDGNLCMLDIHERIHGPHGLVAGMTGSGKSELLMTYILSMAISFSPSEVSFLLIDYKGGGMAQAFKNLPHTAGIITNLDDSAIHRALVSVKAELQRRQQLFVQAEERLNVSNMNINRYQQYVRSGQLETPLPHLLMITDEFAELKNQEPEFMKELISTSRIGRSLGVHLILSTQKPAGIVDDQIWSNTSWRLCLRVQDTHDSMDVIKSPDAAYLTQVGRYYMQTGNVGTLIKGQSGFTGSPYNPGAFAIPACQVEVLDHSGFVLQQANMEKAMMQNTQGIQLTAAVDYLCALSERENLHCSQLWLPPLDPDLSLDMLAKQYPFPVVPYQLRCLIGEADDPACQRRLPVWADLSCGQNTLVYGANGSGKIQLLTTVLQSLLTNHSAQEVHLYLLDYAASGLATFLSAPQVGDVVHLNEDEKLIRLLMMLEREIEIRKEKLEGDLHAGSLEERLEKAGLYHIVVVIHPLSALQEKMAEDRSGLLRLLANGPSYGITFIATNSAASGISYQIGQQFSRLFVLQMPHDDDYVALLGKTNGMQPEAIRGRGLVRLEKQLYEFQCARTLTSSEACCEALNKAWTGKAAPRVAVMPERIEAKQLIKAMKSLSPASLPIGIGQRDLNPVCVNLEKYWVWQWIAREEDADDFVSGIGELVLASGCELVVFGNPGRKQASHAELYLSDFTAQSEYIKSYFFERIAEQKGQLFAKHGHRLIIITRIADTLKSLTAFVASDGNSSSDCGELLATLLLKVKASWHTTFVVCDTVKNMQKLQSEAWYRQSVSAQNALFFGTGLASQYLIEVLDGKPKANERCRYPDGYLVEKGIAERVRFVSDQMGGNERDA